MMTPMKTTGGLLAVVLITVGAFTFMGADDSAHVHGGTVVNCTNMRLVMTDEDGTRSTHLVTSTTRVTKDGQVCEARDLVSGTRIHVTTEDSREGAATAIEAFVKYATTTE
jgi:hypothetical protein